MQQDISSSTSQQSLNTFIIQQIPLSQHAASSIQQLQSLQSPTPFVGPQLPSPQQIWHFNNFQQPIQPLQGQLQFGQNRFHMLRTPELHGNGQLYQLIHIAVPKNKPSSPQNLEANEEVKEHM